MALPPARCSPRPKPCSRTSANCESDDANHRKSSSSSQIEALRAQCGLYSRDISGASVAQQVSTRSDDQPTKLVRANCLSISRCRTAGSVQCPPTLRGGGAPSGPSYSTPTFTSSYAMSKRATNWPCSSNTRNCVRGGGRPASISSRRATVSCGDSAQNPSTQARFAVSGYHGPRGEPRSALRHRRA